MAASSPKQSENSLQSPTPIAFVDLKAQQTRLGGRVHAAIERVLNHGQYIIGPEVKELERALCAFSGARHAVTCASGTDALLMVLMAKGIGPGDAVICPAFTFTATPEVVALLRANLASRMWTRAPSTWTPNDLVQR